MMSDDEPRRWVEDDADALLARLSRAGQADGPSARALRAAPVAVAALLLSSAPAAAGALTAAEAGGAASALATKSALSPLLLLKWVAIGTIGSSSVLALTHAPELLRSAPAVVVNQVASPKSTPSAASSARPVFSEPVVPAREPDVEPEVVPAPPPARDVAREVELLDAARAALVAGESAKALRLLHSLERLPARALVPEATVLQVRALLANGRRAEARALTTRFCESAPNAPQASVLRSLIANSEIQSPRSPL